MTQFFRLSVRPTIRPSELTWKNNAYTSKTNKDNLTKFYMEVYWSIPQIFYLILIYPISDLRMVRLCSVIGCDTERKPLFKVRDNWFSLNPSGWKNHKVKVICHKHFNEKEICGTSSKFIHPWGKPVFLQTTR